MTISISNPDALIAAIPGVLGFTPERSLVIVAIKDNALHCVLRADIADIMNHDDYLPELADAARGLADSMFVIWVADTEEFEAAVSDPLWEQLTNALCELLPSVPLRAAYYTDLLTWRTPVGWSGAIDDDSPVLDAAAAEGRILRNSRAELVASVAPTETMSLWDAENAHTPEAVLGRGLLNPDVRDRLYAEAVGEHASKVEADLLAAARVLPGIYRAYALSTMAFFAYCRGDGPVAGVALDASRAIEDTSMAAMLDAALRSGMSPDQIRKLATARPNAGVVPGGSSGADEHRVEVTPDVNPVLSAQARQRMADQRAQASKAECKVADQ